jgi:two-component system chemotaxis response regulator CheY
MRILIVEDDVSNRLMLSECLRRTHNADVAVNGQEAVLAFQLAHMENEPYQVVLLDIEMPVMDGQETLKTIREMEAGMGVKPGQEAKILMISAHGDQQNMFDAVFKGGASGYLVKPVPCEVLLESISNAVKRKP